MPKSPVFCVKIEGPVCAAPPSGPALRSGHLPRKRGRNTAQYPSPVYGGGGRSAAQALRGERQHTGPSIFTQNWAFLPWEIQPELIRAALC